VDRTPLPTSPFRTQFGSDVRPNFSIFVRIGIRLGPGFGLVSVRIGIGHTSGKSRVLCRGSESGGDKDGDRREHRRRLGIAGHEVCERREKLFELLIDDEFQRLICAVNIRENITRYEEFVKYEQSG